eukprot:Gb_24726 [translate_table: standard]
MHHLMPSSDIITLQSSLRTFVLAKCLCPLSHGRSLTKFIYPGKNKLSSRWKIGSQIPRRGNFNSCHLTMPGFSVIKAVTTVLPTEDPPILQQDEESGWDLALDSNLQVQSNRESLDDTTEMDCIDRQRRLKISKANKGKIPWNKGRKHSPETLARIRERTRQAMQDPKVKKKLINCAHPQSEETRAKISMSVSRVFKERRKKKMLQEMCFLDWQESIAEAARIGGDGETELQWGDYEILKDKLHQEWLQVVAMEKAMAKEKHGGKRVGKTAEQRKKISEAIRAKWADPDYRQRVHSAMVKLHENRPPSANRRVVRKRAVHVGNKSFATDTIAKSSKYSKVLSEYKKKSSTPYSDPLAAVKLEMIKQLRSNRAAIEVKKREATERARLLIAEAEKAAKALEAAAVKDATAQASLSETRKLLAEAVRSMQTVESARSAASPISLRSPATSIDVETLQSDPSMDILRITAASMTGPGDVNGTHYSSFCNNGKANEFVGNFLNGRSSSYVSQYAHEDSQSAEIGIAEVLNSVNSAFVTGNRTEECSVGKLEELRPEGKIGKDTVLSSEENSIRAVDYAAMVDELTNVDTTDKLEARLLPNNRKDIFVDVNTVASECSTQSIGGNSDARSVQIGNHGLTPEKEVRKRWVCGRLVEVRRD